jgi:hypothetical protein
MDVNGCVVNGSERMSRLVRRVGLPRGARGACGARCLAWLPATETAIHGHEYLYSRADTVLRYIAFQRSCSLHTDADRLAPPRRVRTIPASIRPGQRSAAGRARSFMASPPAPRSARLSVSSPRRFRYEWRLATKAWRRRDDDR